MWHRMKLAARAAALALSVLSLVSTASSQTLTTLASFDGTDGSTPWGKPTIVGNTVYGTTPSGGAYGYGTAYSVPTSGGSLTVLTSFNQSNGQPYATLTPADNIFYGATVGGGAYGDGTIYSIPFTGGSPTVLGSFTGGNGIDPYGGVLALVGNTLYGTTAGGGANGDGTVYSISLSGGSPRVLASFDSDNSHSSVTIDGSTLYTALANSFISLPLSGGSPTTVASLNGSNGSYITSCLTISGNTLYATAWGGGAYGDGTVFSFAASGGAPTVLASFNGGNGANPMGSFLALGGNTLYGTTYYGGAYGDGTVFSVPISGGAPTVLASFNGGNGANPESGLTLRGNTLYGATNGGGAYGDGTVFALTLPSANLSWIGAGSGSWNNAGNWDGAQVPGSVNLDVANFGTVIGSGTANVTLDGCWTLSGLTFTTTGGGSYTISRSAGDTTSTLTLTGSLTTSGGNHTIAAPLVLGANVVVSTAAGSGLTVSGPISESGVGAVGSSLTLAGSGRVILSASNTYTGGTAVQSGILVAANGSNGSATGSGIVTLNGGILASDPVAGGSISGEVLPGSSASTIAPGGVGSVGKLTLGSLLTGSNLTLNFDLTTPGGSNDLLAVTGNLTLAPNTAITFGIDPTTDGDYRLIGYGALTGSLSDFDLPGAPPNTMYTLSTTVDPGYIDLVVAVPEPSTFVLLGVGAVGLLGWAWRRRRL